MYDQAIAERIIERYGSAAINEANLRVVELEEKGELAAAAQWRRVAVIIDELQKMQDQLEKSKLH